MAGHNEHMGKEEGPKELVPLTNEEQQIKKWFKRMKMYPVPLPDPVKYMAARMAVAYNLDPFLGEMVFIPQWKGGELAGYQPYVGIGGVRRAARRTGEYMGRELRPCTDEERIALQVGEDVHAWFCQVWRKGYDKPFDGFGVFPMHDKDKSQAPPWRMARKRAEHDALRAGFDLELQLMEAEGVVVEEEPIEGEVTEIETEYEQAQAIIEETTEEVEQILAEAREPEEPPVVGIPTEEAVTEDENSKALWAYAKAKGIATGIVQTVLEQTGGAIEETLARLKEKYGE